MTTTVAASSSSSSSSPHIPPLISFLEESLLKHDVICIRPMASLLAKQDFLTVSEKEFVVEALNRIGDEKTESSVTKLLHSARYRKLEAPTEPMLWTEEAIDAIIPQIERLQVALVSLAVKNPGVIVIAKDPHLEKEQPIRLEHHLLAFVEQLDRDASRQADCRKGLKLNRDTLGVSSDAALAQADPRMDRLSDHSEETTLELLSAISIMANHLSRICGQWAAWASDRFITLCDSSLTVQLNEELDDVPVLQASFSSAFRYSEQEQKKLLLRSVRNVIKTLEVLSKFGRSIRYNKEKPLKEDLPVQYDATSLADYLVMKGVPFTTSNEIVGKAVALCLNKKCQLQNLSLEEFQGINMMIDTDVYEYLGVENSVKQFTSYGSTGSQAVAAQLDFWIKKLNKLLCDKLTLVPN